MRDIAKKKDLFILEDACQAMGSSMKIGENWRNAGTIGDIGIFSFGLLKLINTIQGGAIVTNNDELATRINTFLGYGSYTEKELLLGFNSRMDDFRAAVGLGNLEEIKIQISGRKEIWLDYYHSLKNYKWLKIIKPNKTQIVNYMAFMIIVENEKIRASITEILSSVGYDISQDIKREKINAFVSLTASHEIKDYIHEIKRNIISLPTHDGISENDIRKITECFKSVDLEVSV